MRLSSVIICLGAFLCLTISAGATELTGRVVDEVTGLPLAGVTVQTQDASRGTQTDDDGNFRLAGLPDGGDSFVRLVIKSLGYKLLKKRVSTTTVSLEFKLTPELLPGQDIVVTGDRARRRETPVAFTNLTESRIEQTHWAQDLPMLLTQAPGVYAYSDNGQGIGYSYLSIRGFPQSRISVLINGVPHNDPESHEVYWVSIPDLTESVQDIQIQRGVGSSMYGSAAIGGTININTTYANPQRDIRVTGGFGSYGTRKMSLNFNSGLVNNTYNVYGRFSRLVSDGYRDLSGTDQWSYFLGVARYDGGLTNRLQVYGGQEETHLAYKGIGRDSLITNRKFNPLQYENEIDHFTQPHYELLTNWRVKDNLEFDNTLFYIKGKGYYDQFRSRRRYDEYNLVEFDDAQGNEVDRTDLVRRRFVENDFWGIVPRLTWSPAGLRLAGGGEFQSHRGVHTGSIKWAAVLPPDSIQEVGPDHRYYDYQVRKLSASAFVNLEATLAEKWTSMTAVQYQLRRYELLNDFRNGINYLEPYHILSLRQGVNLNLNAEFNLFANVSFTRQEPTADEIYDPQDFWSSPSDYFKNFNSETGEGSEPIMKPEKLLDLELGGAYRTRNFTVETNLYWMRFQDEIVYNGGLSDDGVPLRVNAPESIHRGVELSAVARPFARTTSLAGLEISGNFSFSDNYFTDFDQYVVTDWSWPYTLDTLDFENKTIAGFPNILANLRLSITTARVNAAAHLFHAGRIYLNNANDKNLSVEPHSLINVTLSAKPSLPEEWPQITLTGRLNNALDSKYETAGYLEDDDGLPRWIVGAERNFYLSMTVGL